MQYRECIRVTRSRMLTVRWPRGAQACTKPGVGFGGIACPFRWTLPPLSNRYGSLSRPSRYSLRRIGPLNRHKGLTRPLVARTSVHFSGEAVNFWPPRLPVSRFGGY